MPVSTEFMRKSQEDLELKVTLYSEFKASPGNRKQQISGLTGSMSLPVEEPSQGYLTDPEEGVFSHLQSKPGSKGPQSIY